MARRHRQKHEHQEKADAQVLQRILALTEAGELEWSEQPSAYADMYLARCQGYEIHLRDRAKEVRPKLWIIHDDGATTAITLWSSYDLFNKVIEAVRVQAMASDQVFLQTFHDAVDDQVSDADQGQVA